MQLRYHLPSAHWYVATVLKCIEEMQLSVDIFKRVLEYVATGIECIGQMQLPWPQQ